MGAEVPVVVVVGGARTFGCMQMAHVVIRATTASVVPEKLFGISVFLIMMSMAFSSSRVCRGVKVPPGFDIMVALTASLGAFRPSAPRDRLVCEVIILFINTSRRVTGASSCCGLVVSVVFVVPRVVTVWVSADLLLISEQASFSELDVAIRTCVSVFPGVRESP